MGTTCALLVADLFNKERERESLCLRNKIFLSVFDRAIKHGSELRYVEIQITRPS